MKKWSLYFILAAFLSISLISCDKDEDVVLTNSFVPLKEYVVANNMDFNKIADGKQVFSPGALYVTGAISTFKLDSFLTNTVILDIRPAAAFATSHIQGAINCTLTEVITKATDAGASATKHALVVDADGQTSPYAVVALRMSGFPNAKILKWGMSSWNTTCDVWTANKGNAAVGNANWVAGPAPAIGTYAFPVLNSSITDPKLLLEDQIAKLLAEGPQTVTNTDALSKYATYHIINYWPEALVTAHGIIKNAYRVETLTSVNLNVLDASKTTIFYCYTGQTAGFLAAWTKVLGYNSKLITYGTNGMIYDDMYAKATANTWNKGGDISRTLPVVQ